MLAVIAPGTVTAITRRPAAGAHDRLGSDDDEAVGDDG
jgi:hypothetical protein